MLTQRTPLERRINKQLAELQDRLSKEVLPFHDDSPVATKLRYETSKENERFGQTYMPHYFTSQSALFHKDLDAITDWHEKRLFPIHGPREHAKSSRTRVALIRRILYGTVRYPLIISETLNLSVDHLECVFADLVENPRIQQDFKVQVLKAEFNKGDLRLRITPYATGKSHTVQIDACSYGTPIKGKLYLSFRPDFALLDDFSSTRTSRNGELEKLKYQWVLQEVYPAVSDTATIIWLGNIGYETSALYQIMRHCQNSDEALKSFLKEGSIPGAISVALADLKRSRTLSDGNSGEPDTKPRITCLSYRAERKIIAEDGTESIEYLWAERYDWTWYERTKNTIGYFIYESEFNGYPIQEGDFFKSEWIQRYTELPENLTGWYLWCDPAFGKTDKSCFKAVVLLASDAHNYYLVDAWMRQKDPVSKMIASWYWFFTEYPELRAGGYENNFGQDDRLFQDLQDAETEMGFALPMRPESNTVNKMVRIESMQAIVANKRFYAPENPSQDVAIVINQLLAYPNGMIDGPDALESAMSRLRRLVASGTLSYKSLGTRRNKRSRR